MRYSLRIMENVKYQYTLLLSYLEKQSSNGMTKKTLMHLDMVRNSMIQTFQRSKEMAKLISKKEEDLYGCDEEFMRLSTITTKNERKVDLKQYSIMHAYKHLNSIL